MATNTYVAIDKVTLASDGGTVTFSNIPQTYTDLRIVVQGGFVDSGFLLGARVGNSTVDSGTNYSYTAIRSSTSSPSSSRKSSMVFGALCQQGGNNLNNVITVDFMNYSNTTTYKSWISRYGNAGEGTDTVISLWRSTAAINTISIAECGDGGSGAFNYGNMLAGTTFSLYGIKAWEAETSPKATGGYVFSDSTYWYHAFTSTSTFVPSQTVSCDYLIVAGGGGGAGGSGAVGGAGGAGGFRTFTSQSISAGTYTVTVGSGGGGSAGNSNGTAGSTSTFNSSSSSGGGYGAPQGSNGGSGGSGGSGGWTGTSAGAGNAGGYSPVEGYAGANTNTGSSYDSTAGAGGAGAAGSANGLHIGGNGGIGATSALVNAIGAATGFGQASSGNYYFAGGGGGAAGYDAGYAKRGEGGLGGGGYGGTLTTASGSVGTLAGNGAANLGGGGGGGVGGTIARSGGNGGSGIVVVRYAK